MSDKTEKDFTLYGSHSCSDKKRIDNEYNLFVSRQIISKDGIDRFIPGNDYNFPNVLLRFEAIYLKNRTGLFAQFHFLADEARELAKMLIELADDIEKG